MSGIQDFAQAYSYNVIVCNSNKEAQQELEAIQSLQAQRVDGTIIVSSQIEPNTLIDCADSEMPIPSLVVTFWLRLKAATVPQ